MSHSLHRHPTTCAYQSVIEATHGVQEYDTKLLYIGILLPVHTTCVILPTSKGPVRIAYQNPAPDHCATLCTNCLPVGTSVPAACPSGCISAWPFHGMAWHGGMVACPGECIALPGREEVALACAPNCLHTLKFGQI